MRRTRNRQCPQLNFVVAGQIRGPHTFLPRSHMGGSRRSAGLEASRGSNLSIHVPEVFPVLPIFPKKDLAFDQPAIAIDGADFTHVIGC